MSVQYEFAHRTARLNSDHVVADRGRRELDGGTFVLDPTATPLRKPSRTLRGVRLGTYSNGVPVGPAYYINQQGGWSPARCPRR